MSKCKQAPKPDSGTLGHLDILHKRQGGKCYYCGCACKIFTVEKRRKLNGRQKRDHATIDHYIPTSEGGNNCLANKVMACMACNTGKSNMSAEEFMLARLIDTSLAKELGWIWAELLNNQSEPPTKKGWLATILGKFTRAATIKVRPYNVEISLPAFRGLR